MPSYVFRCTACGYVFETIIKVSELDAQKCTKCGSSAIGQVFSKHNPYIPNKSKCDTGTGFT